MTGDDWQTPHWQRIADMAKASSLDAKALRDEARLANRRAASLLLLAAALLCVSLGASGAAVVLAAALLWIVVSTGAERPE